MVRDIRNIIRGKCYDCESCAGYMCHIRRVLCDHCGCPPAHHAEIPENDVVQGQEVSSSPSPAGGAPALAVVAPTRDAVRKPKLKRSAVSLCTVLAPKPKRARARRQPLARDGDNASLRCDEEVDVVSADEGSPDQDPSVVRRKLGDPGLVFTSFDQIH
jgi:hypothetical protein